MIILSPDPRVIERPYCIHVAFSRGAGPTNTKVLATNYQGALPRKVNGDTLPCGDTKYRHGSIRIISQPSGQLQRITGVTDGRQSEYYCSHRIGDKFS